MPITRHVEKASNLNHLTLYASLFCTILKLSISPLPTVVYSNGKNRLCKYLRWMLINVSMFLYASWFVLVMVKFYFLNLNFFFNSKYHHIFSVLNICLPKRFLCQFSNEYVLFYSVFVVRLITVVWNEQSTSWRECQHLSSFALNRDSKKTTIFEIYCFKKELLLF